MGGPFGCPSHGLASILGTVAGEVPIGLYLGPPWAGLQVPSPGVLPLLHGLAAAMPWAFRNRLAPTACGSVSLI